MHKTAMLIAVIAATTLLGRPARAAEGPADSGDIERGRYVVTIGACNDCHTPGFVQRGGDMPERDWLTGNPIGFKGPWGTTYPVNLRQLANQLSEEQWLARAKAEMRPPMPWFVLRAMKEADLRAMYRFIRSLGPKGEMAPTYVLPGVAPTTPVIVFEPVAPPTSGAPLIESRAP